MSARSHSSALSAGLVLIALGLIFLIENLYAPFSASRLIARYWPLIIIAIGVKRILDFFLWPGPSLSNNQPQAKE
jgi:hypothetical protein